MATNFCKVWVVELREFTESTEPREVVYETTLRSLVLQTKGGLELDAFETFTGEGARDDAFEFAADVLRNRAAMYERLAVDVADLQKTGARS